MFWQNGWQTQGQWYIDGSNGRLYIQAHVPNYSMTILCSLCHRKQQSLKETTTLLFWSWPVWVRTQNRRIGAQIPNQIISYEHSFIFDLTQYLHWKNSELSLTPNYTPVTTLIWVDRRVTHQHKPAFCCFVVLTWCVAATRLPPVDLELQVN